MLFVGPWIVKGGSQAPTVCGVAHLGLPGGYGVLDALSLQVLSAPSGSTGATSLILSVCLAVGKVTLPTFIFCKIGITLFLLS